MPIRPLLRLAAALALMVSMSGCAALTNSLRQLLMLPVNLLNGVSSAASGGGLSDASTEKDSPFERGSDIEARGLYQPQAAPSILEADRVAARSPASQQ